MAWITDETINGGIAYEEALLTRFEMLKGQPMEVVEKVSARLPLVGGAWEALD